MSTPKPRDQEDTDLATKRKVQRPPLYKVILHNDDYTTRDFVVLVLMRYFHRGHAEATRIMLHIHNTGMGIAGIYPHDIARSKVDQVEKLARQHEMPLRLSIEPEDAPSGQNDE